MTKGREMSKIKSLVYFDLEATGLKSSGRPRITEISFVAVNIEDVKEMHLKIQNHQPNRKYPDDHHHIESFLPRVLSKLTLCVYPMATIMPIVTDITGLDNYNLEDQTRFDSNTGQLLLNFLARLPSPVCLVAHNGNIYDFPLLKAEMEKVGMEVGSNVLCADSYIGIKAIFCNSNQLIQDQKKNEIEAMRIQEVKMSRKYSLNQRKLTTPHSFSLINLHKHMLDCKPIRSHGAEADCLALLRTTSALGNDWVDWVENNCKLFLDIKKMWDMD